MKLYTNLLLVFLLSFNALAANIGDDKLNLGDGNNASTDKEIIFNDGTASKKKLSIDGTTKNLKTNVNNVEVGDDIGTGDKSIIFKRGGSNPAIKWNETLDRLEFSSNGSLYKAFGSGSGSGDGGVNLIENSGFEDGISLEWTFSGGTFNQQTYTNATDNNSKFARFVASGAGQYFETTAQVIPDFLGVGCMADIKYYTTTNNAFKIMAIDGSANTLAEQTLASNTSLIKSPTITFPCPAPAATVKLRVQSILAATIDADDGYIGGNKNLAQIDCGGTRDCEATAYVRVSTGGTVVKDELDVISGNCVLSGTNNEVATCTFNSGIYSTEPIVTATACQLNTSGTDRNVAVHDLTSTSVAFTRRNLVNTGGDAAFCFSVTKTGSDFNKAAPQTAVTSDQSNWFINANIGGANPSLGILSVSSYTGIESASLDLVLNQGSAPAKIPCSLTNASTGLTCLSGNESIGLTFVPPHAGEFKVCAYYSHLINVSTGSIDATFQLVETSPNTQTIIQEGNNRLSSYDINSDSKHPYSNCGIFYFSNTTEKTIRLMFEQLITGTVISSSILADRSATVGQRDIHFTVESLTQNIARPVLTGDQVTTPNATKAIVFSGYINTSTGIVTNNKGGVLPSSCAVTPVTGSVVCSFTSPLASVPVCTTTGTKAQDNVNDHVNCNISSATPITNSLINIITAQGATRTAGLCNVICHGEK